jgi:hypothetical protein
MGGIINEKLKIKNAKRNNNKAFSNFNAFNYLFFCRQKFKPMPAATKPAT